MDLFYVLLVLLVTTRVFGEVAERLGQPSLVGELIAGIALGALVARFPAVMPGLVGLAHNDVFVTITDLGMFFLMLYAGVEMQPHKIAQNSKGAFVVALGGMVLPLGLGVGLGFLFLPTTDLRFTQALFLGTALAITAVPVTVRILMDLGLLHTKTGQTIVSAAVFDDMFSLLLLAWLTALLSSGVAPSAMDVMWLFGKMALFFGITGVIGLYLFPWGGKLMRHIKTTEFETSAMLIAAFAFALLAELFGLHFIVGAFIAGLFFGQRTIDEVSYDRVKHATSAMTFGFLAPIFFASIGLALDLDALIVAPVFVLMLIAAAFFGKVFGAGSAARAYGFTKQQSLVIGFGMSPRGAVELVIAGIALKAGLFDTRGVSSPIVENMFSAVVLMAVVTTVVSPIVLQRVFKRD